MSSVQQKNELQGAETSLEEQELAVSGVHHEAPLDIEQVPVTDAEVEEAVRIERLKAQRELEAMPVRNVAHTEQSPPEIKPEAPRPTERLESLLEKAEALRKRAEILPETAVTPPGHQAVATPTPAPARPIQKSEEPAQHRPLKNIPGIQPARAPAPQSRIEPALARNVEKPIENRPVINRSPRPATRPEPARNPERPVTPRVTESKSTEATRPAVTSTPRTPIDAQPAREISREKPSSMLQQRPASLAVEQATKIDFSTAKIGLGAKPKTITFRGHSLGSGSMLDRLITALADLIKKFEMRFMSFLDRKRLERKAIKVIKPPGEDDLLHLESFSTSLSQARKRRRRIFSRFAK